jgi:hypothetical protein
MPVLTMPTLICPVLVSPDWPQHIDDGQLVCCLCICLITQLSSCRAVFVFVFLSHLLYLMLFFHNSASFCTSPFWPFVSHFLNNLLPVCWIKCFSNSTVGTQHSSTVVRQQHLSAAVSAVCINGHLFYLHQNTINHLASCVPPMREGIMWPFQVDGASVSVEGRSEAWLVARYSLPTVYCCFQFLL